MELTSDQIDWYSQTGYLGLEGVFATSEIDDLRRVTDEFVDESRIHSENTNMFDVDLKAGH